jgi:hypothetical protein
MLTAGSVVLALLALLSMWLISRRQAAGWAVAIAAQFLWLPYDVITGQFGFIAITAASVPVYVNGWRNFKSSSDEGERDRS